LAISATIFWASEVLSMRGSLCALCASISVTSLSVALMALVEFAMMRGKCLRSSFSWAFARISPLSAANPTHHGGFGLEATSVRMSLVGAD